MTHSWTANGAVQDHHTPKDACMSHPQLLTPEEKLADAKARLGIPTIVVICGSTRFMDAMTDADRELTAAGRIVVKPGCNMKQPHPLWATEELAEPIKARLDDLHRAKIRLADEVLVVGNYIGDSTRAEIAYARKLGKPIRFTHPDVTVQSTRYDVSLLPEGDINRHIFAITVEQRGDGQWAVCRFRECLGTDGQWDWEPSPSNREDDWLAAHRFDLDTALKLARDAAPHVVVNGETAADAYRRTHPAV